MDWLNMLFDKIFSLLPKTIIIQPYREGLRYTFGKYVKRLKSGWYIYWPIIQDVGFMDIPTQVIDLRVQSVMTKDVKDMAVGGALQYKVSDIRKAICDVQDLDKSLSTVCLGIITEFINDRTMDECCHNIEQLKEDVLHGVREASRGWGVKIEKIYITDIGHTRNLRLLTNTNREVINE